MYFISAKKSAMRITCCHDVNEPDLMWREWLWECLAGNEVHS